MHFSEIPYLGLGLAADVSSIRPDFRKLLRADPGAFDYLSIGAHYIQGPRVQHFIGDLILDGLPIVFHPLNFNVATSDDEAEDVVRGTTEIIEACRAVWSGQDVAIWTYGGQYLGPYLIPAILDEQSVSETVHKVRKLNESLPCPFLIENPPVSVAVGSMHMIDFMQGVAEKADCGIVLDVGHLIGYQQAIDEPYEAIPMERLDTTRIVELHVAGLQFSQVGDELNLIDQHAYPVHELCWEFVEKYLPMFSNLKGLTLEQEYCHEDQVSKHLERARSILAAKGVAYNA